MPTHKETITVGHQLDDRSNFAHFDLMDNFKKIDLQVVQIYAIVLLIILLSYLAINRISNAVGPAVQKKRKVFESIASISQDFALNKLSSIGLFLLFVKLFFWFSRLVITNNYKTSKVVSPSMQ